MLRLSTGVRVEIYPVSGSEIQRTQVEIPDPEVPKFFIEAQNRWVDNPHHPDYVEAQRRVAAQRAESALRCVVRKCSVTLPNDQGWLRQLIRWGDELLEEVDLHDPEDVAFLYIMREAIGEAEDIRLMVRNACLCDTDVEKHMSILGVIRYGADISKAGLRHRLDTGITYKSIAIGDTLLVHPVEEYGACAHSSLSWENWREGKFGHDFMLETIAHYRINRLIESHAKDAEADEIEKNQRKGRHK